MTPWSLAPFETLYAEPSRNGVYKSSEHHGSGAKIVNMGELFAHEFIGPQNMARLTMSNQELEKAGLQDGDLLFGRRSLIEAGAGKCSLVDGIIEATTFESSIIRVRLNTNLSIPRFYYYWFRSPAGRGSIRAIVSGTNVKGIRSSDLKTVKIPIVELRAQQRIVDLLRPYEDLIENNCRRIQLLEESARLLYQEWFVHLRFPGHEHAETTSGVPKEWRLVPLKSVCSDIRNAIKPDQVEPDTPYIGLEHIPRRSITLNEWGFAEDVESNKFRYIEGDILFGKIRPYFHKVGFTLTDGICSSDAIVIRAHDNDIRPYILALVSSDQFVAIASKTAKEGSKMPRADWKFMQQHPILLPSRPVLLSFRDTMLPIMQQLKVLALQNQKLAQARDLLLPHLMNGEITV